MDKLLLDTTSRVELRVLRPHNQYHGIMINFPVVVSSFCLRIVHLNKLLFVHEAYLARLNEEFRRKTWKSRWDFEHSGPLNAKKWTAILTSKSAVVLCTWFLTTK